MFPFSGSFFPRREGGRVLLVGQRLDASGLPRSELIVLSHDRDVHTTVIGAGAVPAFLVISGVAEELEAVSFGG